jgi:hypothetical protein
MPTMPVDGCAPLDELWEMSKYYIGAMIEDGAWRFSCNPQLIGDMRGNPVKLMIAMVPRWVGLLSKDSREKLWPMGLMVSVHNRARAGRKVASKRLGEFLLRTHQLLHDRDPAVRKATLDRIAAIKSLWFEDELGKMTNWDKGRLEAVQWLSDRTRAPFNMVKSVCESWARRFQDKPPCTPDWTLISRIFRVDGDVDLPGVESCDKYRKIFGWNPRDKPTDIVWVGLDDILYADDSEWVGLDDVVYTGESERGVSLAQAIAHDTHGQREYGWISLTRQLFDSQASSASLFYRLMDIWLGYESDGGDGVVVGAARTVGKARYTQHNHNKLTPKWNKIDGWHDGYQSAVDAARRWNP